MENASNESEQQNTKRQTVRLSAYYIHIINVLFLRKLHKPPLLKTFLIHQCPQFIDGQIIGQVRFI